MRKPITTLLFRATRAAIHFASEIMSITSMIDKDLPMSEANMNCTLDNMELDIQAMQDLLNAVRSRIDK